MQQPFPPERTHSVPTFYLTGRQTLRPGAILLAIALAAGALCAIAYAMSFTGHMHLIPGGSDPARSADSTSGASPPDDKDDDPSQVDTIVLGDPSDAPVPARRGNRVSPVHPTILVHLPRFGAAEQRELRRRTGGYTLLSAKEVQPGVVVFRLRDQTPEATEALGTLQMRPNSTPPAIASFSLRAIPSPVRAATPQ
jgi:hypothetical protein